MDDNKEALPVVTTPFRSLDYIKTDADLDEYVEAALSELRAEVERLTHKLQTVEREASEYYRRGPKIGSVIMRHELHDEALQIISHGISSSGSVVIIVASNKQGAARSAASGDSAEGGV